MIYDIVTANEIEGLVAAVKRYLDDGWQPVGGVSLTKQGEYMQAIVHDQVSQEAKEKYLKTLDKLGERAERKRTFGI